MKKLAFTCLTATTLLSSHAQLVTPETITGGVFGALIGGLAGGNCHDSFSGNSAALGAGIGILAGSVIGEVNRQAYAPAMVSYGPPAPAYVQPGYGYVYQPAYVYAPPPQRPNYAIGGTLVGALAGGLIGVSQDNGWAGAGIGAASGLVLGGIAEAATRNQEQKRAAAAAPAPGTVVVMPPATNPPPVLTQQHLPAPVVRPHVAYPASGPLVVHQIPDARRVPDAPTF